MNTLFDISPALPPGFHYEAGFISTTEEDLLISLVKNLELDNMKFHQYEAKRKVISFGQGWSFSEKQLKKGHEIPREFDFLVERIAAQLGISKYSIAQFLVTEYPVGSVINWHRDAPPFDIVAGVSLLSNCNFRLRPHEKEKQTRAATTSLPVEQRSLYTLQGPAKTAWQHCTAPVNNIRYSLTFRTVRA